MFEVIDGQRHQLECALIEAICLGDMATTTKLSTRLAQKANLVLTTAPAPKRANISSSDRGGANLMSAVPSDVFTAWLTITLRQADVSASASKKAINAFKVFLLMVFLQWVLKNTEKAMPTGEWNPQWVQFVTFALRLPLRSVNSVCIGLKQQGRPLGVQTRNG